MDETAFNYKAMLGKGYVTRGMKLKGGKPNKARVTAVFLVNMDGSDKARIAIIGVAVHPRCLTFGKKVKQWHPMDVDYYHQSSAWMDGYIFRKMMQKWNRELVKQGRKVCLLMDNFSAHKAKCSNIEFVFLPPNCTSVIQPLDQGIIKMAKDKAKRIITAKFLTLLHAGHDVSCVEM